MKPSYVTGGERERDREKRETEKEREREAETRREHERKRKCFIQPWVRGQSGFLPGQF